ncbi:MAG: beta-lactamase family protein [Thermomicrobiales bacterium]|nr:beta-lactamase family protein [Thermomicrobiales bacterium]
MVRSLLLALALLLTAGLAPLARAQDATPAASPVAEAIPDLTGVAPQWLEGERKDAFAAFMADALATCAVPGASVAVVQNGEVVFLEGFGVRHVGRSAPVTPDTLMDIGSVTKSFTATYAATLVDAGLVSWDTPVIDLLPDFTLSDPEVARRLTLADLYSAASGLPRRDLELVLDFNSFTPRRLLAEVATLPLTAPVGERYQYSNQAFAIGGYAAAAADGAAPDGLLQGYELGVRARVLDPLGMERSTFDLVEVLRGDYATPHATGISGTPEPVSLLREGNFVKAVAPAGALWSSAREMAAYLQMQLGHGLAPDGDRVVSVENLERTWAPGVAIPPNPELPPVLNASMQHYGLGWAIGDYGGLTLISHSGGTFGFSTEVAFLPEADLGIAVLTNESTCGGLIAYAAQYRLFELVFDQEPRAADEFTAFLNAAMAQREAVVAKLQPVDESAAAAMAGRYTNLDLGEIAIRREGREVILDAGEVQSRLRALQLVPGGPLVYVPIDPPLTGAPMWLTVQPNAAGQMTPVITLVNEPTEPPLLYPFTPVATAAGAAATPAA